jgi:hypothetical protein
MKKSNLIIGLFSIVLLSASWTIFDENKPSSLCDAPLVGGHTGAPGETSCTGCHAGTNNTGPATLTFNIGGGITQYIPGQIYSCTVAIAQAGVDKMGFSCLALKDAGNVTIGTFLLTDAVRTRTYVDGIRNYVSHKPCGADAAVVGINQWTFDWQAPATNQGNITLYLGALATNHNHATTGDSPYTRSITLIPSAAGINETSIEINNFNIHPNPCSGFFNISLEANTSEKTEITIYNIQGKKIKNLNTILPKNGKIKETMTFQNLDLQNGIYLLKLNSGNKEIIRKLVVSS